MAYLKPNFENIISKYVTPILKPKFDTKINFKLCNMFKGTHTVSKKIEIRPGTQE